MRPVCCRLSARAQWTGSNHLPAAAGCNMTAHAVDTWARWQARHPHLQPDCAERSLEALALHLEGAPAAPGFALHLRGQPLQAGGRRLIARCRSGCEAGITGAGMASTASGLNDAQAEAARHRELAQDTHAAWTAIPALQSHKADLDSLLQLGLHLVQLQLALLQLVLLRMQGSVAGQGPGLQLLRCERTSVRGMQH